MAGPSDVRDEANRRVFDLLTMVAIAVGLALHIWFLLSPLRVIDSDEAVVGLMARRLAFDADPSVFFWGQQYGGAHESILIAVLMVLRVPQFLAVKLVPLLLFAGAAALVWRIARKLAGEGPGRLAGALVWAAPAGLVWMSIKERGYYGATLVLGLAVILFALRLRERWRPRDAVALGVAAGSAFYASPQSVYLVGPALVWLAAVAVRDLGVGNLLRPAAQAASGFVLGAAPWLAANVRSGFASLDALPQPPSTFGERLEIFATRGVPVSLGLRNPFTPEWLGGEPLGRALYAAVLVAALAAAIRLARSRGPRAGTAMIVLGLAAYPLILASLPTSWFIGDPRYLTFLPPLLAVMLAVALARLRWQRLVAPTIVTAVLGLAVIGANASVQIDEPPGRWDVAAREIDPLVDLLDEEGVDRAFADYWIAYRLTLETEEDVIASPLVTIRHPPYEEAVRCAARPAYAVFDKSEEAARIEAFLSAHGIGYTARSAAVYRLIVPDLRVVPEQISDVWAANRASLGTWKLDCAV